MEQLENARKDIYKETQEARDTLKSFSAENNEHRKSIDSFKSAMERFDEILLDKASKLSLQRLEDSLNSFVSKDEYEAISIELEQKHTENLDKIESLNIKIDKIHTDIKDVFQKSIKSLTREVKSQVMKS